jgi:hypothetical protein
MNRPAVAYLLTLVLLVCPHFCLGESASEAGVRTSTASYSCNCGHREPVDTPTDAPDSGDPDCLCQGAVLSDSKIEATDVDVENWLPLLVAPKDGVASAVHVASSGDSLLPCHFPAIMSGSDVCVLTCALLL